MSSRVLRVGVVGAHRGGKLIPGLLANGVHVAAVCDIDMDGMRARAEREGWTGRDFYDDYDTMLDRANLDAVVVGTPQQLHVPQSIKALDRGLHVLSEVTAGVSIDECKDLVRACRRSRGIYMMAENSCYMRSNMIVRRLVQKGYLGQVYYAEGEYLHEVRELMERTPWRRKWHTGIDGVTYPTHSLGPILQCMEGDRVARVCCEGSGHHYKDPRGENYHQDTAVMLCKTVRGALIKIRYTAVCSRPYACTYQVQGTEGVFESHRRKEEHDKICLHILSAGAERKWFDIEVIDQHPELRDCVPEPWRTTAPWQQTGHGGSDHLVVTDFVNTILGRIPCPIGIHEAMDMTLPGLVSQQSIAQGGQWIDVPDSRTW